MIMAVKNAQLKLCRAHESKLQFVAFILAVDSRLRCHWINSARLECDTRSHHPVESERL